VMTTLVRSPFRSQLRAQVRAQFRPHALKRACALLSIALVTGCATTGPVSKDDPWEPMNRALYGVHDAIDIPAAAETPVLAAADGKILKLFQSDRGGTTIYQLNANGDLIFYYAHLSHYADGLMEGNVVKQGQVIAYVGDTGNAGAGNYHLHFSIATVSDPKRYWEGTNINPYPLLHDRTR